MQRFSPYSKISSDFPLFQIAAAQRRSHWNPGLLIPFTLLWLFLGAGLIAILWLLTVRGEDLNQYPGSMYDNNFQVSGLFVGIALAVLLDFRIMMFTANSFAGEVTARRWDVLRLTPLTSRNIVHTLDAIGQLRVWRFMALICGVRLAVGLLILRGFFRPLPSPFFLSESEYLMIQLVVIFFMMVYCVEPFWRMRAVVALGLWISSRLRSTLSIVLAAIGAVMLLWLSQVIMLGVLSWLAVRVSLLDDRVGSYLGSLVYLFAGVVFYSYYRLLRDISLGRAEERIEILTE